MSRKRHERTVTKIPHNRTCEQLCENGTFHWATERRKCKTIRDENRAVLRAFDDNPGGSILLSRFSSTRNTQSYHFQQNGLQPEIFGPLSVRRNLWIQLDGCSTTVDSQRCIGRGGPTSWPSRSRDVGSSIKTMIYRKIQHARGHDQLEIRNAIDSIFSIELGRYYSVQVNIYSNNGCPNTGSTHSGRIKEKKSRVVATCRVRTRFTAATPRTTRASFIPKMKPVQIGFSLDHSWKG